jgi:hypothetical protein
MENFGEHMKKFRGRPCFFSDPSELQVLIEDYFAKTPQEELTITGLCISLGITRATLGEYLAKPAFSDLLKQAKEKVQNAYERDLRRAGRSGDIFALKNFGWVDKQDHDITSGGERLSGLEAGIKTILEKQDSEPAPDVP